MELTAKEYIEKHLGVGFSYDHPFQFKNVLILMDEYHKAKIQEIKPCKRFECSNAFMINLFENR